jgi:hypothetical protein
MVDIEGGKRVLFRFYDPRVMRVFIPTCDAEQRKEFFGKIESIYVESDKETAVHRFAADRSEEYQLE